MQKSARILGYDIGLNAEEMNCLLKMQGFLTGEPNCYEPTEKALPFVIEKDFHRGTGGYSHYNRYWTTRTYDDSILNILDLSPEQMNAAKNMVKANRAAKRAAQIAEEAISNSTSLATIGNPVGDNAIQNSIQKSNDIDWEKIAKVGLYVGGTIIIAYVIYKAVPQIKQWWQSKHKKDESS